MIVPEPNEQTTEYENRYLCCTSFRFSYRLLVGQSGGELLKLSDDGAVPLGPCRDVSLLIVVQEVRNAGLGGFCGDFFRSRRLDSQGWVELDVHDQVSGVFEGQHRKDRFGRSMASLPRRRPFERFGFRQSAQD